MSGELLLGLDVGTYGSKGVVCQADGTIVAEREVEHDLSMPAPGRAEHDADAIWWHDFVLLCRQLISDVGGGDHIGAVGCSAIGPCLLPIDAGGHPLRPAILYGIDTRAAGEIEELNRQFGEQNLFAFSGMALTSQAIGPKLLWLRTHEPGVFGKARWFLSASSYLVLRLTGEIVLDYHSASHFNPLYDPGHQRWSEDFAGSILDLERLPRLAWPTEVTGTIGKKAAAQTGLRAGTPVTTGTIDAAAEALSVGVMEPGDLMLMYGTTMFMILITARRSSDARLWSTAYCLPDIYDLAAGMSTTGALTRWLRDEFGQDLLARQGAGGQNAYAALAGEAAATPPGADGLVLLPYFSGERSPIHDPEARGVIAGLTLRHTRGHLYRAILEATGFGVRQNLAVMREAGAVTRRVVAVGGGTRNRLWLQAVSDIIGQPQEVPARTIGACYGDAFLAGLATGIVPSLSSLRQWVQPGSEVQPDPSNAPVYDQLFDVYSRLYERTKSDMHKLARLSASFG